MSADKPLPDRRELSKQLRALSRHEHDASPSPPTAEPVAWRYRWPNFEEGEWGYQTTDPRIGQGGHPGRLDEPLYASLVPAEPVNAEMLAALKGVVAVADRETNEFIRARAAIAKAEAAAEKFIVDEKGNKGWTIP